MLPTTRAAKLPTNIQCWKIGQARVPSRVRHPIHQHHTAPELHKFIKLYRPQQCASRHQVGTEICAVCLPHHAHSNWTELIRATIRTRWEQKYHIPLNDATYMCITHWSLPLDVIILLTMKQLFTIWQSCRWKTTEAYCYYWQQPCDWLWCSQQEKNMVYWWWECTRLIKKVSGLKN